MGYALKVTADLETQECYECGVAFALPDNLLRKCREKGADFYCPNGHCLTFKDSEVKKLQRQLEEEKRKREMAQNEANAERERGDKIAAKLKRAEKRASVGVCPFGCKRTFTNLAKHVHSKHPDQEHKATGDGKLTP